jgi:hypothetical protein
MKDIVSAVFLGLFLLLFLPIKIQINLAFDLYKNKGTFFITLFNKLKLPVSSFTLKNGALIVTGKKRNKQIDLKLTNAQFIYFNELQKSLLGKLILRKFRFDVYVGVKDNAFLTSLISGQLQVLLGMLFGFLYTKK